MDKQAQEQFDHAESGVASFAYVAGTAEERRLLRKIDMVSFCLFFLFFFFLPLQRRNLGV